MVAEFRTLRQAEFALAAVDVRVDGDAVSRLDIGDISADRSNDARIFVAKYDRRHRSGRSGATVIQVMIRTAHTCICGVDQHFIGFDLRCWHVLDFEFLDTGQYKSFHDMSFPL